MAHTIRFNRTFEDPCIEFIRKQARADGWVGQPGFKEFAKLTYSATMRTGRYGDWTSISFATVDDMNRFKQDAGCRSNRLPNLICAN